MAKYPAMGIYGGSFDPIHLGHLRVAEDIRQQLALESIRWIPCGTPPHRADDLADGMHRLAMVQCAIADNPHFQLDDIEVRRKGPSYMIDTLVQLKKEDANKPHCLIIGSDAFSQFHTWRDWQDILDQVHLVVMNRANNQLRIPKDLEAQAKNRIIDRFEAVHSSPAGKIVIVPVTQLEISATQIRQFIAQGKSVRYLLPKVVIDYIRQHRLYEKY